MEVDSGNREEGLWLSKLLERQREVEISKERATERLSEVMGAERGDVLKMPQPIQVCIWFNGFVGPAWYGGC